MKITRKTIIRDAALLSPEHASKMTEYGLHCVYCPIGGAETLEQGCKAHGFDDEKIDKLLKELNEISEVREKN